ncbi:hypothetical protein [Bradyrhizobium sp. 62B]|uniref:hypothetical protein n=1 Tax=Bradyrhizobium sp. 62B TaxID=2898442 RepID=UPI002557E40A
MIVSQQSVHTSLYGLADVTAAEAPLIEIMTEVLNDRHKIYETEIRAEYAGMQSRNELLTEMNSALAVLRANRPADDKHDAWLGEFTDTQGRKQNVDEWLRSHNIAFDMNPNRRAGQSQFDAAINNLKAAVDGANSEGHLAIIFLQGLLDKLNQVALQMSNLISKDDKVKESIIANMR